MSEQPQALQNRQYGRYWRVTIYAKNEDGGTDTEMDVSTLRCVFKAQYNRDTAISTCTLVVYNMNVATEKAVIQEGFQISIWAGYEQAQYGEIFTGDIVQVIRNRENGVDYRLEILAIRSIQEFSLNFVRASIAAGSTPRDQLQQIATNADKPLEMGEMSENLPEQPLPRAKVYFGTVSKYMRDICIWNNGRYEMGEDGKINVHLAQDEIQENECLVITPNTGLVGTPKYTDNGINIRLLMDARVKIVGSQGTLVKLDNDIIQKQLISVDRTMSGSGQQLSQRVMFDETGEYMAISVTHSGDTHGDEWYTDIVGLSRNGRSSLVSMMENDKQSITA